MGKTEGRKSRDTVPFKEILRPTGSRFCKPNYSVTHKSGKSYEFSIMLISPDYSTILMKKLIYNEMIHGSFQKVGNQLPGT
jgi:hypothetical protein